MRRSGSVCANCGAILLLAHASLRSGAPDYGNLPLRDKRFRQMVAVRHPHLWLRTLVLIVVTFLPFVLAGIAVCESALDVARVVPSSPQTSVGEPGTDADEVDAS